jgi:hypothetical protein
MFAMPSSTVCRALMKRKCIELPKAESDVASLMFQAIPVVRQSGIVRERLREGDLGNVALFFSLKRCRALWLVIPAAVV